MVLIWTRGEREVEIIKLQWQTTTEEHYLIKKKISSILTFLFVLPSQFLLYLMNDFNKKRTVRCYKVLILSQWLWMSSRWMDAFIEKCLIVDCFGGMYSLNFYFIFQVREDLLCPQLCCCLTISSVLLWDSGLVGHMLVCDVFWCRVQGSTSI